MPIISARGLSICVVLALGAAFLGAAGAQPLPGPSRAQVAADECRKVSFQTGFLDRMRAAKHWDILARQHRINDVTRDLCAQAPEGPQLLAAYERAWAETQKAPRTVSVQKDYSTQVKAVRSDPRYRKLSTEYRALREDEASAKVTATQARRYVSEHQLEDRRRYDEVGRQVPVLERKAGSAGEKVDRKLAELFKVIEAHGVPGNEAQRLGLVY